MFSGKSRHLFGAYAALLFLVILSTHHSCSATKNNNSCTPSSCGNIHNISYPFRLNTDPKGCGLIICEIICENNRPTLYLNGGKYYVQAIDYKNFTIRLVDAGVQKDDCFSIPQHTIDTHELFPYDIYTPYGFSSLQQLAFLTCPEPILSAIDILDASSCKSESTAYDNYMFNISSPSSHDMEGYSYLMVRGYVRDIPDLCRINLMYPLPESIEQKVMTTMSYADVHDIMVYGFELQWFLACCNSVEENCHSFDEATMGFYCEIYRPRSVSPGPIRVAIESVANRILSYLAWPIRKHLPYGLWPSNFLFFLDSFYPFAPRNGFSDLLSILIILLIMLLIPNVIYRVPLFICGLPCLITLLIYKWRRKHLSMYEDIEEFLQSDDHNLMPVRYSYSEIKKITNGFKDKLGEGGFGSVYKGKLRSGRFAAIKILDKSKANGQDFMNEVATIGRIHHVNVVQLIGFTVEGSKHALIYEFLPNGSLEKYIFSRHGYIPLSNEKIYEISLGVARGIEYLHQGCDIRILHFDIKPHNILLDENFVPKVSDFGLAKLYPTKDSIVALTAARGTMGYMAPELFYKNIGGVSYKADVYSFGMLLMEMVGRRKNLNALANQSSQIYFPSWVYDQVSGRNGIELGDHATEQEKETTKKMIIVALWCIQWKPNDRPSMHKVVKMLEGDIGSLQMTPKPFFTPQHMPTNDDKANPINLSDPANDCIDSSYQFGR